MEIHKHIAPIGCPERGGGEVLEGVATSQSQCGEL